MENIEVKTEIEVDPATGEILTPLRWDTVEGRYIPYPKEELSIWELYLIDGSSRLRAWAIDGAKIYQDGGK